MKYEQIKGFAQRCECHPDHKNGVVTQQMIQQRLQEEIDELRDYIEQRKRKPLTDEEAISAYQRGYLDGIHRDCPHCADYKAMYLRVRDELAALQQSKEST